MCRAGPGFCPAAVQKWARIPDVDQYLYARSTKAYLGGVREWRGAQMACVDETDFEIQGIGDCEALGLQERRLPPLERDRARARRAGRAG
jgi:uncharacterized membrane protein